MKYLRNLHGILVVDKPGLAGDSISGVACGPLDISGVACGPRDTSGGAGGSRDASTERDGAARLPTSHDIVQRVRRWSGQRRIGHTGTLDPMASGVLVLCLGLATRLVEYYQGHDKRYYAEITLGAATDTYDATGQVVAQAAVPMLTRAQVEGALAQFRGTIQQQPPVYSALKQGGETAHRRARRGQTVELASRPVTFYSLEWVDMPRPDCIALRAHCSAGTYIRSLAHDLGQALGVPAHLSRLRREAAGAFTLADAHSLSAIEAAAREGRLHELLRALGDRLNLPAATVSEDQARRFGFGQTVELAESPTPVAPDAPLAQAFDVDGRLLGIIRRLPQEDGRLLVWKAEKWLEVGNQ